MTDLISRARLKGTITTQSEVAISLPSARKNTNSIDMAPKKVMDGTTRYYIPSSSIRGMMRSAMHMLACDTIKANGHTPLTYLQHARNAVGGVKGSETGTPSPEVVLALFADNHIIDAFGGGEPVFAEGSIKPFDAVSREVVDERVAKGGVRADFTRRHPEIATPAHMADISNHHAIIEVTAKLRPLTDASRALEKRQNKSDEARARIINKLQEQVGEIDLTPEKITATIKRLEQERVGYGGSTNTLLRPLPDVEMIPQGIFDHRIEIHRAHPQTIGMFLLALKRQAKEKMTLGGLTSRGNGFFTAEYTLQVLDDTRWVDDCTIILNGEDDVFEIKPVGRKKPLAVQWIDAYEKALKAGKIDFTFKNAEGKVHFIDEDSMEAEEA